MEQIFNLWNMVSFNEIFVENDRKCGKTIEIVDTHSLNSPDCDLKKVDTHCFYSLFKGI